MNEIHVILADYYIDPGPRFRDQDKKGQGSGEQFRRDVVEPAFQQAVSEGYSLIVDIGGTWGIPPSFREETFGGLVRSHVEQHLYYDYRAILTIISSTDENDVNLAWEDIDKMTKSLNVQSHL